MRENLEKQLFEACKQGDMKKVISLVENGANVNYEHKLISTTFVDGYFPYDEEYYRTALDVTNSLVIRKYLRENGALSSSEIYNLKRKLEKEREEEERQRYNAEQQRIKKEEAALKEKAKKDFIDQWRREEAERQEILDRHLAEKK